MGTVSHLSPRAAFARLMNDYMWHVARAQGWDRSGRKMEAALGVDGAQKRTYWLKVLNNHQAMTTQDVATIATHFGVSPYEFIDLAKGWDEAGQPASGHLPNVGPHPEDYNIDVDPGEFGLAAKKRPNPKPPAGGKSASAGSDSEGG